MDPSRKFLWLILTHQPASMVEKMVAGWQQRVQGEIVILYGGARAEFDQIKHLKKAFVHDSRLVTKDHPRERQSYDGVFEAALEQVAQSEADFVYFTEFDQIPLRDDIADDLALQMETRHLDMMGNGLQRIDQTNHPHWLNHQSDGALPEFLKTFSVRRNKAVILTMFGFGQCWRKEGFLKVAGLRQEIRCYLELWIPTVAHHLGLRVGRNLRDAQWNTPTDSVDVSLLDGLAEKPYFVHPIKGYWL